MKYLITLLCLVFSYTFTTAQPCDSLLRNDTENYTCPELSLYYYNNPIGNNPAMNAAHEKHQRKDIPTKFFMLADARGTIETDDGYEKQWDMIVEQNIENGNIYIKANTMYIPGCRLSPDPPTHKTYTLLFSDGQTFHYIGPYFNRDYNDYFLLVKGKMRVIEIDQNGNAGKSSIAQGDSLLLKKLLTVPLKSIGMRSTVDKFFWRKPYYDDDKEKIDLPHPIAEKDARKLMQALQCMMQ